MSKPLKAGIWYSASNIMLRSVSIITAPIFTRLLTTEDYGKISNFTSWQNILAIFMGVFLNYSIGRAKIDLKMILKVIFLLFKVFLVLLVC